MAKLFEVAVFTTKDSTKAIALQVAAKKAKKTMQRASQRANQKAREEEAFRLAVETRLTQIRELAQEVLPRHLKSDVLTKNRIYTLAKAGGPAFDEAVNALQFAWASEEAFSHMLKVIVPPLKAVA